MLKANVYSLVDVSSKITLDSRNWEKENQKVKVAILYPSVPIHGEINQFWL